ncbi:MAG TPA: BsuPI-related putative proteinase inhibitor [Thermodesulfobacteriota bacterium]|nr:BsuPI-related putative proteinase inhibitor [Thermodesulfobacteriota bacterium]
MGFTHCSSVTHFVKLLIVIPFLVGCARQEIISAKEVPKTLSSVQNTEGLKVELNLNKPSYKLKEPTIMILTVTNKSKETCRYSFRSSQVYDFVVKEDNKEIWRWSADEVFAQVITELTLAPGKSESFEEIWEQVDNEGKNVRAGKYQVIGILATQPERISHPVSIEIR